MESPTEDQAISGCPTTSVKLPCNVKVDDPHITQTLAHETPTYIISLHQIPNRQVSLPRG